MTEMPELAWGKAVRRPAKSYKPYPFPMHFIIIGNTSYAFPVKTNLSQYGCWVYTNL